MLNSKNIGYIVMAIVLFGGTTLKGQSNLNKYKYIIVPKKFEDFKTENQHQTNSLVKHLFTKKGFTTYWEDDMPDDLANNQCKALFVSLKDKSSMFSTKAAIVLDDCNKQEIFSTIQAKSRQKDYKKAYSEVIQLAMNSFDGLNYKYVGDDEASEPITVSFDNDVKKLEEPKAPSSSAKTQNDNMVIQEATPEKQTFEDRTPEKSNFKKAEKAPPIVEVRATTEEQLFKSAEPEESNYKKGEPQIEKAAVDSTQEQKVSVLYAQQIPNGYQLVDSTPKILMKILKTSMPDYYLAEGEGLTGMVYSKDGKWYFERYEGENLVSKELNIKF